MTWEGPNRLHTRTQCRRQPFFFTWATLPVLLADGLLCPGPTSGLARAGQLLVPFSVVLELSFC